MNEMSIPVNAVRGYIENAIDIVIQIDRLTDGKRKITSISEVDGIRDGEINLKEIFSFNQTDTLDNGEVVGKFTKHRGIPKVIDRIKKKGITTLDNIF